MDLAIDYTVSEGASDSGIRILRVVILAMIAAILILAHGCHGDDVDHELFALSHRADLPVRQGEVCR